MAYLCEICGQVFKGDHATAQYNKHMAKHRYDDTPVIRDSKRVVEYEVREPDPDDCSPIQLKDINSGSVYHNNAYDQLLNTNINLSVVSKLIGKKIRITSYAEIIE